MSKKLDLIFFGNYPISLEVLKELLKNEDLNILSVITRNSYKNGVKVFDNKVANYVKENHLDMEFIEVENIKEQKYLDYFQKINFDILFCVSFSELIPKTILDTPKYGSYNLHPSLLPDLKGPDPIRRALKEDYAYTGVSIHKMTDKFDEGEVVFQKKIEILFEDTLGSMLEKTSLCSVDISKNFFSNFKQNSQVKKSKNKVKEKFFANYISQDEKTITKEYSLLQVYNLYRALYPYEFVKIFDKNVIVGIKNIHSIIKDKNLILSQIKNLNNYFKMEKVCD